MDRGEAIPDTSNKEAKPKKSASKKVKRVFDLSKLKKKYLCQQCDYASKYSSHLKMHVEVVHEGLRRFACDQCDYRSAEKNKIERHKASIHGDQYNVSCDRCNLKFKTRESLRGHIKTVHERHRLAKCAQCNYTAKSPWDVREHTRAVHERPLSLACDVVDCDYRTDRQQVLRWHLLKKHLKRNVCTRHQCPMCDYSDDSKRTLQDHVDFKHEKNFKYICDVCNTPKRDQRSLDSHKKIVHDGIKDFVCNVVDCKYKAAFKYQLKKHISVTHLKRDLRERHDCPRCDYSTNYKTKLQHHVDFKHEKKFKYVCDVCNCPKSTQKILESHKKAVHQGIKEFECDVVDCEYKAADKNQLKMHVQVKHLNMKRNKKIPNKCDSCDYSVTSKKAFQDHVNFNHERVFNYMCDICHVPQPSHKKLGFHKKVSHDKLMRFKCDHCTSFTTNKKVTLEDHMSLAHLDVIEERCPASPYRTRSKKLMRSHANNHEKQVSMKEHSKVRVEKERHNFDKCSNRNKFSSRTKEGLQDHVDLVHDKTYRCLVNVNNTVSLLCVLCPFKTVEKNQMRLHQRGDHKEVDDKDENNNNDNAARKEKGDMVVEEEEVTFTIKVKEEDIG